MQSSRFLLIVSITAIILYSPLNALSQPFPTFDHVVPTLELSTASTTAIIQDQSGYIWIGTTNGLNRFDGRQLKKYFFDAADSLSISNEFINHNALFEHKGFIWIGTEKGLNKYDPSKDTFERFLHNPSDPSSLCGDVVNTILASSTTTLWIGTRTGLCRFDLNTERFQSFVHNNSDPQSLSYNAVTSLALDSQNRLWVGTRDGLNLFDYDQQSFTRHLVSSNNPAYSGNVFTLHANAEDLWIGTNGGGLMRMHVPSGTLKLFKHLLTNKNSLGHDLVSDITTDKSGHLWVATFGGGLCKYDKKTDGFSCYQHDQEQPASLIDDQVISIMEDYEGHIWAATWNGVTKMNRNVGFSNFTFTSTTPNGLSEPRVNAIYEDDKGLLWLGGITDGLSELNPRTGSIKYYQHNPDDANSLSHNEIWSITGEGNVLWIGTAGGLNKYDRASRSFTRYFHLNNNPNSLSENRIYSVFLDSRKTLWVSTPRRGINKLADPERGVFEHFRSSSKKDSLSSDDVWPIYQDEEDILWFGTLEGGLNKYEVQRNKFTSYQYDAEAFSISSNSVLHISSGLNDDLWLGTLRGLNKLDRSTHKFYVYTEENGLSNNEISCVLREDNRRLWIGTRNGLSVFDLKEKSFLNFYEHNGLPSASFLAGACIKSESGNFYFGTDKGLVSFLPDRIDLNMPAPRLLITEFRKNNTQIPFNPGINKLELPFKENNISFRVSALTFSGTDKNTYYYRMIGIDTTWTQMEPSGLVNFTTLPANDYTLEFNAKNSLGIYSQKPLSLDITILPPFWQSWRFRLFAGLFVAAIFSVIYISRTNYLVLVRKELEAKLKIEKLRHNVAADFHDGIGSGLGGLGLDIDLLTDRDDIPHQIRAPLIHIRKRLNNISDIRRDMSWVINSKNDSFESLVDRIRHVAFESIPADILSIQTPETLPQILLNMDVRKHLIFFVREALHNVIKHARATQIQIDIVEAGDMYTFSVADNGIGFDSALVDKGEGLDNMAFRADSIGAIFEVIHPNAGGTRIQMSLKMDGSSYNAS